MFFWGGDIGPFLQIFRKLTFQPLTPNLNIPPFHYRRNLETHPISNVQAGLAALIESVGSVEAAGEAIYSTLFEAAPSVLTNGGSLDGYSCCSLEN